MLDETASVRLPRGVRLRFDPVRGRHVLLAPERIIFPCPTTVEILQRLGEGRRIGELVDELAAEYDAPRAVISADVLALLDELARGRFLHVGRMEERHVSG